MHVVISYDDSSEFPRYCPACCKLTRSATADLLGKEGEGGPMNLCSKDALIKLASLAQQQMEFPHLSLQTDKSSPRRKSPL